MTDNVVSFEKRSEEIMSKRILEDTDSVANSVIEACMVQGEWDYDLAIDLLAAPRISDETDGIRKTLLSMTIERIERKGYRKEAMELRNRLNGSLDHAYEKLMQRNGTYTLCEVPEQKKRDEEIYYDVDDFCVSLTKEERNQIDKTVEKVFADEIPFSEMSRQEAFAVMKDVAKYAFYHGDYQMKTLLIDNQNQEITLSFISGFPFLGNTKDAFAYLVNVFDEMFLTNDEENQTTSAHFDFFCDFIV